MRADTSSRTHSIAPEQTLSARRVATCRPLSMSRPSQSPCHHHTRAGGWVCRVHLPRMSPLPKSDLHPIPSSPSVAPPAALPPAATEHAAPAAYVCLRDAAAACTHVLASASIIALCWPPLRFRTSWPLHRSSSSAGLVRASSLLHGLRGRPQPAPPPPAVPGRRPHTAQPLARA